MYMLLSAPVQVPPSWACRTFGTGCPAPVVQPADSLASIEAGLSSQLGLSGFRRSNYTQEFYPPPYGFAGGLGCAGGNCDCGGACSKGMGLFDSMDFTTWGAVEWGLVVLGGSALFMALRKTQIVGESVHKKFKRRRRSK